MSHDHLKQHLPFIVEMIESVKTIEFRQKWQIMKELIESNKLTGKQIETIEINIKKAKELKEQYKKKTVEYTSLSDTNNTKDEAKNENVPSKIEKSDANDLKVKKQMKELKRLHENIVKDDVPLPSKRRSAQKRSYRDSLEILLDKSDDFTSPKKKKSDNDFDKKDAATVDAERTKRVVKIVRKSLDAPKTPNNTAETRKSKNVVKLDSKVDESPKINNELITSPKPVEKIVIKSPNPAEITQNPQRKRKIIQIQKPFVIKKIFKEPSESIEHAQKTTEIAKKINDKIVIRTQKIIQKINDAAEDKQILTKSASITKPIRIVTEPSKTPIVATITTKTSENSQQIPKIDKIEPKTFKTLTETAKYLKESAKSESTKSSTESAKSSSKSTKSSSESTKSSSESTKSLTESTKSSTETPKSKNSNDPIKVTPKQEAQLKPVEIKKTSMDKLRKKLQMHQKKEIFKKKSRVTLLTKGASLKKGSKIDDDEWEDLDDSEDSELNEEDNSMNQDESSTAANTEMKNTDETIEIVPKEIANNDAPSTSPEKEQKPAQNEKQIIIKKVHNISYIPCKTGFIFKCLVQNCKFQTMDNPAFVDHIENEHLGIKWTGQCDICNDKVDTVRSIIFELMHMRENHVLKENSSAADLPDIIEYSEPEKLKEEETKIKIVKIPKVEEEAKKEIKSAEKIALVGKKIDIGKIKLMPYKGTPLSQKSPEIEKKNSLNKTEKNVPIPKPVIVVEKDSPTAGNKIIKITKNQQEIPSNTPDGKQKIVKHIIVKPSTDKETAPLIVKPKQPKESAQKQQVVNKIPQNPNPESKLAIQVSTDSQKDVSSADILRPWLKKKVKKYLMPTTRFLNNVGAIISTYKCMSSKCSFFTSDRNLFNAHLKCHESHQTGDRDYMNCSYCDHTFNDKDKILTLVEHIDNEHCYDKYQCKYCFYRSCVSLNVINHQQVYHAMKPKSVYELSCDKNRNYELELEAVKQSRVRCVPPLSCVKCNAKFYVFQKLTQHMQTHGPTKTKCTKCSKVSDLSSIHTHFINCHKLGLYQCVYCVFGSNNFDNIINHIGSCHPSKPPIYCERSNEKADEINPASIESTCLKFLTQQVDHRLIETPKINQDILKNEKSVGDLGGNFKVYPVTKAKTPSPNKSSQTVKIPVAKIDSTLKKVEASAKELMQEIVTVKKKNTKKTEGISNKKNTGLQINSVFSLNQF